MKTVGIIEAHRLARQGIEQVLCTSRHLDVVASVGSVAELPTPLPDIVVLNPAACAAPIRIPTIRSLAADCALLILSGTDHETELVPTVRAGARSFVTQNTEPEEFLAAVEAVARGAFYVTASVISQLHEDLARDRSTDSEVLAPREMETLRLVARGYTHSQIARRLGISAGTVNTYVKRIRAKLNLGNKAELTRKAIELGYLGQEARDTEYPARSA